MSKERETPVSERALSTAPEGNRSLPSCERRGALLALAAMTGAVVVQSCTREAPVDPPPGASGERLAQTEREAPRAEVAPTHDGLGPRLPLRRLGSSGLEVTLLGVGGVHVGDATERDAQEVVETAIAEGIRFFDTAHMYSGGLSEERLGKYLVPKYRDHVFLMSKSLATNAKDAAEQLETSLRRCRCDYLDLWQLHALKDPGDVNARVEAGVLDVCERAIKEGKVKHLGFTGHASYKAHLRMLEHAKHRRLPVAAAQMPINLIDPHYESFTTHAMGPCIEHGIGILAMKTLAFGRLLGRNLGWQRTDVQLTRVVPDLVSLEQALSYVWSLPISVLISGMENAAQVRQNAAIARDAASLDDATRLKLVASVERFGGRDVEFYKD